MKPYLPSLALSAVAIAALFAHETELARAAIIGACSLGGLAIWTN